MKTLLISLSVLMYIASGWLIKQLLSLLSGIKYKKTDNIGMTIGYSERLLAVIFVVFNQYTALALIIAAKSILRFPSGKEDNRVHKESEYVLVGTMLSLVFGILNGLLVLYALNH
ncbi:hypothetical protein [Salinicoccus carnicancri]|uniref:hypothetical protein n=1 Tax=Salinicoccus carnicancri TaxID=558170 RepID=UPI0002ED9F79|nr:hypothetical protein [Salinicoccus carnicancri]